MSAKQILKMGKATEPTYLDYAQRYAKGIADAPVFSLPDGVKGAVINKRADVNTDGAIGRGGIYFFRDNNIVSQTNRMLWFEGKDLFQIGPPASGYGGERFTVQQWSQKGDELPIGGMEIDEFGEGNVALSPSDERYVTFKQRRKLKYQNAGIANPELFIAYGSFLMTKSELWKDDGNYKGPLFTKYLSRYDSKNAARASAAEYFAIHFGTSLPNIQWYPQDFNTAKWYYMKAHEMETMLNGMGPGGLCAWVTSGLIESVPGQVVRPGADTHIDINFAYRTNNPAGTVKATGHPDWDYDLQKATYFVYGCCLGRRFFGWDDTTAYKTDINKINQPGADSFTQITFTPDQQGVATPFVGNREGYAPIRQNWYDIGIYSATHAYQQCNRTAGGDWKHLRFRVDQTNTGNNFGPWYEPKAIAADCRFGPDILYKAATSTGDCRGRVVGQAVDFFYFNPMLGKHKYELVQVEIGGVTFTNKLKGGELHVYNESTATI